MDAAGGLSQQPLTGSLADPVALPAGIGGRRFEQFLSGEGMTASVPIAAGALAGFTAVTSDGGRTLAFSKGGRYLSAERDQQTVSHNRVEASGWESFAPISHKDLALLRGLAVNRWLIRSTGAIVEQGAVEFGAGFTLRLGGITVDLRYQLPFEGRLLPYRISMLREGWRLDEACMLRPLVVMTAFRTPAVHEQALLSLQSLREIAGYAGHVLLLTDLPDDVIQCRLAGRLGPSTTVITMAAQDMVSSAAARYALLDWPHARHHQPILCVDPDVIFDADITPVLAAIAASSRIAAPVEAQSLLRTSPEAGASLLQQDGPLPRLAAGFSVTVLGIPNLVDHRDTLQQIRRVLVNRTERFGRNEPGWLEQEIANYVCHRMADADTHLLSRFMRTVPAGQASTLARGAGLLRFGGDRGSEAQTDAMRAALRALAGVPASRFGDPAAELASTEDLEGPAL